MRGATKNKHEPKTNLRTAHVCITVHNCFSTRHSTARSDNSL